MRAHATSEFRVLVVSEKPNALAIVSISSPGDFASSSSHDHEPYFIRNGRDISF